MRFLSRTPKAAPRPRPQLELLEDRAVPANISFQNGTLTVGGMFRGNVAVSQSAVTGYFTVTDNGNNNGTYQVTNGVTVNVGNQMRTVTLNVASGQSLAGDYTVNLGNQNTTLAIDGAGSINGGVNVNGGYGTKLNLDTLNGDSTTVLGDVTVYGTYGNNNAVMIGNATTAVQIGGNLGLHALKTISLGQAGGGAVTVNGNATIDMQQAPNSISNASSPLNVTFNTTSTVLGTVSVTNPSNSSTYTLNGATGATTLGLGNGTNNVALNGTVNGSLTVNASNGGSNTFTPGAALHLAGITSNLTFNITGGLNTYNFQNAFTVDGGFALNAGTDNGNEAFGFGGNVGNNAVMTLGNGTKHITFVPSSAIGGDFIYQAGTGNNTVTVNSNLTRFVWTGTAQNQKLRIDTANGSQFNTPGIVNMSTGNMTLQKEIGFNGGGLVLNSTTGINGLFTDNSATISNNGVTVNTAGTATQAIVLNFALSSNILTLNGSGTVTGTRTASGAVGTNFLVLGGFTGTNNNVDVNHNWPGP